VSGDATLAVIAVLAVRQTCPLVIAAMGGILSERSGVVNIALEGLMLAGAFVGVCAGSAVGTCGGFLAALIVGAVLGALHLVLTQRLRVNQIVSGVAINLLALHASTFFLRTLFSHADPPRDAKLLDPIPVVWFVGGAVALPLALHWVLCRTVFGLRLRASGESALYARMAGVSPGTSRTMGVVLSGVLAAAAGACVSMSMVGRFTDDMVGGRGFIALAAVVCGRWTPLGAALTCCAFGIFDATQLHLQGTVALPAEAMRAVPYVLTIVAAVIFRSSPPADLGADEPS
jgi:simple sugar transport system permease protein